MRRQISFNACKQLWNADRLGDKWMSLICRPDLIGAAVVLRTEISSAESRTTGNLEPKAGWRFRRYRAAGGHFQCGRRFRSTYLTRRWHPDSERGCKKGPLRRLWRHRQGFQKVDIGLSQYLIDGEV